MMEDDSKQTLIQITKALETIQNRVEEIALEKAGRWNENHDNLLQNWRKQASINLWLQLASNYYYTRLNDYLSYPAIIVSAATSIGVFGIDDNLGGKLAISVMALVTGILTAINKHCRAAEKGQEFALRAKDYYTFIREIDFILSTSRDERGDLGETLERVKNTYDRIVDMQLEPPIHVIRDYEKKFRPLENSLFSDLKSEMRNPHPEAPCSPRPPDIQNTRLTTSPTFDGRPYDSPNEFREEQVRFIPFVNFPWDANSKRKYGTHRQSAIFSPYQLFGSNPGQMRQDGYDMNMNMHGAMFTTDDMRASLDAGPGDGRKYMRRGPIKFASDYANKSSPSPRSSAQTPATASPEIKVDSIASQKPTVDIELGSPNVSKGEHD